MINKGNTKKKLLNTKKNSVIKDIIITAISTIFLSFVIIYGISDHNNSKKALKKRGIIIKAIVIERTRLKKIGLKYRFYANYKLYKSWGSVYSANDKSVGDSIEIIYDSINPEINMLTLQFNK